MNHFIAVRVLSKSGELTCLCGWICLIVLLSPAFPGWCLLAVLVWAAAGVFMLARWTSASEVQTFRGLVNWTGLLIAWPLARNFGSRLFAAVE